MLENMKRLISESKFKKRKLVISITSLVILLAGIGFTSYEVTKASVTLNVDGKEQVIRTHANTVAEVLEDYDIKTRLEDDISPSIKTKVKDDMKIVLEKAKPINLVINGKERKLWTTEKTVENLLSSENIEVSEHDKIEPKLNTAIDKNMNISVDIAFQIALNDGGKNQQVWSTSTTVADFLEQQNIKVNKLDRIEPSLDTAIDSNTNVKITRVEKVTDVVEEPVDYAVVTRKDSSLLKGKKRVLQSGKEGLITKHYEVILENGKQVSRILIKSENTRDSIDQIVAVGSKVAPTQVSRGSGKASSEFYVNSTAFTAHCNGCSGVTRTGINLITNPNAKVIAVDPSIIPLGTKVYVDGYGYAVAGDTGSAIKGYEIDVFFASKSDAYRWGTRRVKIKILK